MMNRFWRWINNRINNAHEPPKIRAGQDICVSADNFGDKSIEFKIFFAEGGVVLQRFHYDHVKDRSHRKLFLIDENKDVAKEVGDIVAMEILRA